jgi:hypothetical protein
VLVKAAAAMALLKPKSPSLRMLSLPRKTARRQHPLAGDRCMLTVFWLDVAVQDDRLSGAVRVSLGVAL